MAPVHAEDDGFRVRVLWLNIANPRKARALLAPSRRSTKISGEHLRLVARLEYRPLEAVHEDMGTRIAACWVTGTVSRLSPTAVQLCHVAGGELEQIQFLLGHVSDQTTERYLGSKQKIRDGVNDRIGLEPEE